MKDQALQIVRQVETEHLKLNRLREYLQHLTLRDLFDLLFYLTRWEGTEPNLEYLNNGLEQTGYEGNPLDANNWKDRLRDKVEDLDWSTVKEDVRPFLLNPEDLKAFRKEFLMSKLS